MYIGILSGGSGWHVQDLLRAAAKLGHTAEAVDFRKLAMGAHGGQSSLEAFDRLLIRTMPAGSLEQVVFRMDLLHMLHARGRPMMNSPRAVELCVDKFLTSARLADAGLLTPMTTVCQRADDAQLAFERLGKDVVVKPLFGAEGRGMLRISNADLAWRTFRAIEQTGGVLYLQEFVPHPGWDIRAFMLNGRLLAAIRRTARGDWRTNVAQGGCAEPMSLSDDELSLARKAAVAVGATVCGVDLLPGPNGERYVIEVNAVPGWRALAEVCRVDVAAEIVRFIVERGDGQHDE